MPGSEDLDELLPSSGEEKAGAKSEARNEVQRRGSKSQIYIYHIELNSINSIYIYGSSTLIT